MLKPSDMKDIQEKLDQQFHEFNREQLWNSIDKPEPPKRNNRFWLLALVIIGAIGMMWLYDHNYENIDTEIQQDADEYHTGHTDASQSSSSHIKLNPSTSKKENTNPTATVESNTKSSSNLAKIEKEEITLSSNDVINQESKLNSLVSTNLNLTNAQNNSITKEEIKSDNRTLVTLDPINTMFSNQINREKLALTNTNLYQLDMVEDIQILRNRMNFRLGIGTHQSQFIYSDKEAIPYRSILEEPLIDYNIGVGYEYMISPAISLAVNLDYYLIKDKIVHSTIDHVRRKQIDYTLYNHYHSIRSSVEMSYHQYFKSFVLSGSILGGWQMAQSIEMDYFENKNELTDPEVSRRNYRNSVGPIWTFKLSLSKSINQKLYSRLSIQHDIDHIQSNSNAKIRHRRSQQFLTIGLGMRF